MWHTHLNGTGRVSQGMAALAFALIFLLAEKGTAAAHGGLAAEFDTCVLRFAGTSYRMHFSGYQPNSQQKEFCEDIPEAGPTTVALDYFSPELRRMDVELRIIRNNNNSTAESSDVNGVTVIYLPPQKRPKGTFNFEHNFEEGKYVGLLKLHDGTNEYISRFPFAVGVASTSHTMHYSLIFLVLIGGGTAAVWALRNMRAKGF